MNMTSLMIATAVFLLAAGSAAAQMDGEHMGDGDSSSGSHMVGGRGYGMEGTGEMPSRLKRKTMSHGYMGVLDHLDTHQEAVEAMQHFIDSCRSDLWISEIWEYETVYKAELSDTSGAKAFDLMADKFTGAVTPLMGLSMMMNASYGRRLYRMGRFEESLEITPKRARRLARRFVENNGLDYTLDAPEMYPGFYKFHTMDRAGGFGMDIMVNGYNGKIWMDSFHGAPVAAPLP
jgi:hypothetical protein